MDLTLPDSLIAAVSQQSGVLFLGSAASYGAKHPEQHNIPSAVELKNLLSDRFLGGKLKDRTLAHVSEMCISETDLITVQSFVRDCFLPFEPAEHHLKIPSFFWHAIVTTNYDLIVERSYAAAGAKQDLAIFVKDQQQFDTELKKKRSGLPYIKLHGSVDRVDDPDIPLILSTEQYVRYDKNRRRIFNYFQNFGYEFPIIFCGYSIEDPHIQTILFDLANNEIRRPRYYLVNSGLDEVERRYWEAHRITCINAKFSEFLDALDAAIPEANRALPRTLGGGAETVRNFYRVAGASESDVLSYFLTTDVDHVRLGIASAGGTPKQFYTGYDNGWGPIEGELDVRRRVTDNILVDAILAEESERQSLVDLHVLKGPAGHGKSTTLRRVAWEASSSFEKLCLFLNVSGTIRLDAIQELYDLVQDRLFLFVDHAALHVEEISYAISELSRLNVPLTIITAERNNEWNVRCAALDEFVALEYALRPLSETEIHELLQKLERHEALGRLADFSYAERFTEFAERAERQLLVALHEATLGKPFEEIVRDEYERIIPAEAQTLYLDVCTLNRLGVGVRAGLISRISGIRFEDFKERFLAPLDFVVKSYIDSYVADRMYAARHSHVADLVFQLVLSDPEARFDQMIRILDGINISYSTDSEAFRGMIRGRDVAEIFASYELANQFYDRAAALVGDDPFLLQQRAIFEIHHPGGNLTKAEKSLIMALDQAPYNKSIQHSFANLKRLQANFSENPILRDKHRLAARQQLRNLVGADARFPHGFHTKVLLLVDDLRDLLSEKDRKDLDGVEERRLVDLIREIEATLNEGQQRFPYEEMFLTVEADYRTLLDQNNRAFQSLQKAFERNPRSEWVAKRLSQNLLEAGKEEEAKTVLLRCVADNPGSKPANYALARLYMRTGNDEERKQIPQLLRRSFSEGDSNFDAQFWYAREQFLRGELGQSIELFDKLKHAPVSPTSRTRVRGLVRNVEGSVRRFQGVVSKKEEAYLFVTCEGFPRDVYCNVRQANDEDWEKLQMGSEVQLEIGFNMLGPVAAAVFPI